jgi:hypothetical protein
MAYIVNGLEEAIDTCPEQWTITARIWDKPVETV